MKIAIVLFGELFGSVNKADKVYKKDFRDNWPNIKSKLIDPFVEKGFSVKLLFSCYPIEDEIVRKDFYNLTNPHSVFFNKKENSNAYSCKRNIAANIPADIDFVIAVRSDLFFSRKLADEDIDYTKFNFLFPEGRGEQWWGRYKFTCDTVYMWPIGMNDTVREVIHSCYRWPRKNNIDSHGLWLKLIQKIRESQIHFVSRFPEPSDVNSFYTINRPDVPPEPLINDEVWDRYLKDTKYNIFNY